MDDVFRILGIDRNNEPDANDGRSLRVQIEQEVSAYLAAEEDRGDGHQHFNPLMWWKGHEAFYPNIARLALKYLAIPASTAPAERVFSVAKNILVKKRWRLLPERLEKCIFLRHNKQFLTIP